METRNSKLNNLYSQLSSLNLDNGCLGDEIKNSKKLLEQQNNTKESLKNLYNNLVISNRKSSEQLTQLENNLKKLNENLTTSINHKLILQENLKISRTKQEGIYSKLADNENLLEELNLEKTMLKARLAQYQSTNNDLDSQVKSVLVLTENKNKSISTLTKTNNALQINISNESSNISKYLNE